MQATPLQQRNKTRICGRSVCVGSVQLVRVFHVSCFEIASFTMISNKQKNSQERIQSNNTKKLKKLSFLCIF